MVDNKTFKKKLFRLVPDAIGGEMEATGIIDACSHHPTRWLIIKAICDWGENEGDGDQPKAARNAIEFFWQILKTGGWYTAQ